MEYAEECKLHSSVIISN